MSKTETTSTPNPSTSTSATPDPFAQFVDQFTTLEAQMMSRARQAIEAWAQLAQDALAYSAQLSAQARKLGLETARKMQTGSLV
jgi:hypothetical protein